MTSLPAATPRRSPPSAARPWAVMLAILVLAASLAACGKEGAPRPPDGDSEFPRTYPAP